MTASARWNDWRRRRLLARLRREKEADRCRLRATLLTLGLAIPQPKQRAFAVRPRGRTA